MSSLAFWRAVVQDRSNFLGRVIQLLEDEGIRYCVIGGVGVNAYAEPVVTQDLDVIVDPADLVRATSLLAEAFRVEEFEHSVNVRDAESGLQVQLQKDSSWAAILDRSTRKEVMGLDLPVADAADLMEMKVAAASDPSRRPSKRQKAMADIARLLDVFPNLAAALPEEIQARLIR